MYCKKCNEKIEKDWNYCAVCGCRIERIKINLSNCTVTKEKALNVYKEYKEKVIKKVIDSYEGIIPEPHYSRLKTAMYNYEVEIDD